MRSKQLLISGLLLSCSLGVQAAEGCPEILNHSFNKLNSSEKVAMCQQFKGEVLLIVNTASQCGFTPQYKQLERIHQKYKDKGFSVVGFPSNDFKQDRGSEADTAKVCYLDYGVTFPMMERTNIKGETVNPVFQSLAHETGVVPQWNFFKYVIDRKGDVVGVFSSRIEPTDDTIIDMIEKQL
ncbi:glutathione peroxidase [Photobacterium sagamiensis]|uniref:glutathione peroxidase n=1 Tax=Photobacterium sagamiensis TaxID=2910241 RepID=UPI003D0F20B4